MLTCVANNWNPPPRIALRQLSPKDKTWDRHKKSSEQVAQRYRDANIVTLLAYDAKAYSDRINQCSQVLGFQVVEGGKSASIKLASARFCRISTCPICQWRRSLRWRARLIEGLGKLLEDNPTYQFLFLTLTVRNCPVTHLRATVQGMQGAWRKLTKLQEWKPIKGYIRSLEVTRNAETGEAHPHYHALLVVTPGYFKGGVRLSQARITELWQESLGIEYIPIVHIRKVSERKYKSKVQGGTGGGGGQKGGENLGASGCPAIQTGVIHAILETAKYTVKPKDLVLDQDWLVTLTDQLFRTRRTVTGGVIAKYLREDEEDGDLIHVGDEPSEITLPLEPDTYLIFDWEPKVTRYLHRE